MKFIQHVGLVHAHEPNFSITCGVGDCQSTFSRFHSFRKHVYRKHRCFVFRPYDKNDRTSEDSTVHQHSMNPDQQNSETDLSASHLQTVNPNLDKLLQDFRDNLFAFVLKCREKNLLHLSVQQDITDDVKFLFCFFKENYDSFISYHLGKSGFDISKCPELQQVLHSSDFFDKAYEVVRSPHMIKEHCKAKMDFTEPVHYTLKGFSGYQKGTYSYVPISEVLKKYCSHEDVWDQILSENNKVKDEELLTDYGDGLYFKEHLFFREHPDALRLHLYEDEFEIVNPLGSKRTKHKLCAFYYTVGNLSGKYRSQLKHIHLALLVRYSHVKQFGIDMILKPMIEDLQQLSTEGVIINVCGTEHKVYAALATFSGDNLSAHMIGGFRMCFQSGRICRYCMATHSEIKHKFQEDGFVLRTAEIHDYHLQCVQQNKENSALYGVRCTSPFNALGYFDVTKSLPPDVMHDMLEGVLPLTMKHVICQAHRQKHITIAELNEELQKFCIGQNDKANKPVLLSERLLKTSGIVGTATQKWCLFRLLPFLMGHRIPPGSKYWHVFLVCREIADIVMAPKVRKDELAYLEILVHAFLSEMTEVFGNVLTPKCHYLVHYPRLMCMYGPLRSLWCMQFEGKHQYFKNLANNCRNFRNVTVTLSNRHQLKQCWEFLPINILGDFEKVPGRSVSTPLLSLPIDLQTAIKASGNFKGVELEGKVIQRVSEVTVDNIKYAVRDVLTIDLLHVEKIPVFGQIKYILNIDTMLVLCSKMLLPLSFDTHFHAYRVKVDSDWILLKPRDELDHMSLDTYTADDNLYVGLRHLV